MRPDVLPDSRLPSGWDTPGMLSPTSGRCANPLCEIYLSAVRNLDIEAEGYPGWSVSLSEPAAGLDKNMPMEEKRSGDREKG